MDWVDFKQANQSPTFFYCQADVHGLGPNLPDSAISNFKKS